MAEKNSTIINSIWLSGTNDFQQRIPQPTQSSMDATIDALFDPMNGQYLNQFVDALITRIGYSYVHHLRFDNPLKEFKGAKLTYAPSVQEIAVPWIKAHAYENDVETLLKIYKPDAEVVYHSQNRQDKYPITINRADLRTAFTSEYGLNDYVAAVMETPRNSDEYDEFQIMKQLIAFYNDNLGFYQEHLSAVPNDMETGKEFLKKAKTLAGKIKFPSTRYNSNKITNIPVFVDRSELILFVTPELSATLDVDTLALLFHVERAEVPFRIVEIDEFPIPNAVALLTTRDFYVCHDTEYTVTNFYNPETLNYTYYLHHWGVYSVSPFVPAILFTTDEATNVPTVTMAPTGITVAPAAATVDPGSETQLTFTLNGSVTPDGYGVALSPSAVTTKLSGAKSRKTRVDKYGVLHVGEDETAGAEIAATFTSTYVNPSGATSTYTANGTYTVSEE